MTMNEKVSIVKKFIEVKGNCTKLVGRTDIDIGIVCGKECPIFPDKEKEETCGCDGYGGPHKDNIRRAELFMKEHSLGDMIRGMLNDNE
jgi:hypothetical protein